MKTLYSPRAWKAWGGTFALVLWQCPAALLRQQDCHSIKTFFCFEKWILCFCVKSWKFFWKVLLLSFSILFLPTKHFHSAFEKSFMTFIWSLQGNLLPAQTQSKSKATLRRPRWMKLQYNSLMLRIMIPLPVSIEIRGTCLQCRIFILLTFVIDFQCSNPVLLKYPPHQLQNVNTVYKIFHLFYHQILFN